MLNIAAFMCVKNDEYYVDMAIKSVLPFVKGIYIQDQYSDDGAYEKILAVSQMADQVVVERVDSGIGRFNAEYDEPKFRTMAIQAAETIFNPDWILKLDADEIYTEYFFRELERILVQGTEIQGVKVAGDRFISTTRRAVHPSAIEYSPEGLAFVDPHTQVWKAGIGIHYGCNAELSGFLHPVLIPDPQPLAWINGICNIHIHRIFGPKALLFWQEGGDAPMSGPPYHPPTMAKSWYESAANMGNSETVDFQWPDYVLGKWHEWGIW